MSGSRSPATQRAPLTEALGDAIANWSNDQRTVVVLAAEFADSGEWVVSSSASAAHWIAASADIEVCTAREWIRVGRTLRSLPLVARLFDTGELSYSKVRTLTRVATSENESALVALAADVPAGQLGRAIAAWMSRTSDDVELERLHQEQRSVVWRNEPDGMVTFTARLAPLAAGQLIARLQTHIMTNRPDAASLDAWPSLAQQHADALSALIAGTAGSLTTEVVLHIREDKATPSTTAHQCRSVSSPASRPTPSSGRSSTTPRVDRSMPVGAGDTRLLARSGSSRSATERASTVAPRCSSNTTTSPTSRCRGAPSSTNSNSAAPPATAAATNTPPPDRVHLRARVSRNDGLAGGPRSRIAPSSKTRSH